MSRVLIVEDEDAIAEIEKDYLELSGFEVVIKSDGTSGLANLQTGKRKEKYTYYHGISEERRY